MTQTGPDVQPSAEPGQPYQSWGPGQQPAGQPTVPPAAPATKSGKGKKIASIAGAVVVAGGAAAFKLTGGFGIGDPSVGDCIQETASSFEVVDCDAAEAQYKILGVEKEEQTFEAASAGSDSLCLDFPATTYLAWYGDDGGEGKVYCAGDIPAA
jgi:hypothetical protein